MKNLLGNVVRVALGALVVYSCAGKSISNTDGDDPPPTADDGFTGGIPGAGGSGIGATPGTTGRGGTTTGKGGGGTGGSTIGKGGSPGTGGRGGSVGKGGRGGTAGTSGLGGTSGFGGDDGGAGFGGEEQCPPIRNVSVYEAPCNEKLGCTSLIHPLGFFVRRNQVAPQFPDGAGGEGGGGDAREDMASAWMCGDGGDFGYLAFDYYVPADAPLTTSLRLVSGPNTCGGAVIGSVNFLDFEEPPPGTWTTQCLEVHGSDLHDSVSIDGPSYAKIRNVQFVSRCECPRQITRYTTCGAITSPAYCR